MSGRATGNGTGSATGAACATGVVVGAAAGAASFTLSATLRPGVAPERLEAAVDETVSRLLQDGPTEEERARSVRQITAGALLSLDGFGNAPRMLGGALSIGLPIETVEFWPRSLREVTLARTAEAARAVLGGAPSTTGWLVPGESPS